MLALCTECGLQLNYIPAWVDGNEINASIELCRCEHGEVQEYTLEEIDEYKEYFVERREDQELNEREQTLFDYLEGLNGEIPTSIATSRVEIGESVNECEDTD